MNDSIPWREAFPDMTTAEENGIVLEETRKLLKLTRKQLAELTGISEHHILKMESGEQPIDEEAAKKLARALNTDYKLFL
jgi:transcriptional regulator with XRE-family HTH domain